MDTHYVHFADKHEMPSSIGNESGDRVDGASNVADYFLEIGLPDDLSPEKETSSSRRPPVQYPITEISRKCFLATVEQCPAALETEFNEIPSLFSKIISRLFTN